MKLRADQLPRHTQEPLLPVYAIYGDETLLVQEAADTLRAAARKQGFTERELMHADRSADWNELLASANTMSLFGDRRIIEVRFTGKPDAQATAALEKYSQNPSPDNLLLLILPKLDGTALKAKWFVSAETTGASVAVPTVDRAALPNCPQAAIASLPLVPRTRQYWPASISQWKKLAVASRSGRAKGESRRGL